MPIERAEDVYNLRVWKWATSPNARVLVSAKTGQHLVPAEIRARLGELAHHLQLRELREQHLHPPRLIELKHRRRPGPRYHGYAEARADFAPHDELSFLRADVRDGLARLGINSVGELLANSRSFYILGLKPWFFEYLEASLRERGLSLSKG
ncbi:hypothetical protein AB4Y45_33555 [Paraburkholderia sp. EG287A]|uniref:hypothetical protein n=1 Tax=Paraburkholderia sp. EG287A TaxID=3237012 RepID=UPI0034D1C6A8